MFSDVTVEPMYKYLKWCCWWSNLVVDLGILLLLIRVDPGHNLLLFIIDVDPVIHFWYLEWPQWCIIIDHWCCRSLPPACITCRSNGHRSCFIGTIWSTSNMDWRGTNTNNKTDPTDAFQLLCLTRSNWYTTQKLLASWKSSQHQANFYLVPN